MSDGILKIKSYISMDNMTPGMAAVKTAKHGRQIIILMGEDPKNTNFIRAADREGNAFRIRKAQLYCLLTGRKE